MAGRAGSKATEGMRERERERALCAADDCTHARYEWQASPLLVCCIGLCSLPVGAAVVVCALSWLVGFAKMFDRKYACYSTLIYNLNDTCFPGVTARSPAGFVACGPPQPSHLHTHQPSPCFLLAAAVRLSFAVLAFCACVAWPIT